MRDDKDDDKDQGKHDDDVDQHDEQDEYDEHGEHDESDSYGCFSKLWISEMSRTLQTSTVYFSF